MKKMRSIVYKKYGGPGVLTLMNRPVPDPLPHEVLIKVISSSVTAADWHLRRADPFMVRLMNGVLKPKKNVPGQEFYGKVEKTGSSVTRFSRGDILFGSTGLKAGANAEYIVLPEESVMIRWNTEELIPKMATVPIGSMAALYFLKKGYISAGQSIMINGASGSVGTYAVQIAKSKGASVTGVCSTSNADLVRSLGADDIIDYKREDIKAGGQSFDIILDTVGNLKYKSIKHRLKSDGYFISTAYTLRLMAGMLMNHFRPGKKVVTGISSETQNALDEIKLLIENGELTPVIDREYTMEQIREAHEYAESGHKRGNLLVHISKGKGHV